MNPCTYVFTIRTSWGSGYALRVGPGGSAVKQPRNQSHRNLVRQFARKTVSADCFPLFLIGSLAQRCYRVEIWYGASMEDALSSDTRLGSVRARSAALEFRVRTKHVFFDYPP